MLEAINEVGRARLRLFR